ncbi:hypothetical protein [Microbacterium sp.]|uniref:hypothetical protein n=1 Tax=Microbacterium sp. TaxID=51671 RepID=UPI0039E2B795
MPRRSAAVYRRRRIVFFGALVLVLAAVGIGVWLLIARPWVGAGAPTPASAASDAPTSQTPASDATGAGEGADAATEEPDAAPTDEETPGIAACVAADVKVEAVTDADSYEPGALPQMSIRLTNVGTSDCTIDVGSSTQVFTVSSGDDVWWRSTDCQQNPSSMIATLAAGATVESKTPVPWDRTRSSVDTCDSENRQRAPGGGASYHVDVQIGGFPAVGAKQILLY